MIDLLLSKQNYETLKNILTIIDSLLQDKIDTAKQQADKYKITLTTDELESLAGYIAAEANHAEDKIRQRKLDRLYDIVNAVLEREEWKEKFKRIIGEIGDEMAITKERGGVAVGKERYCRIRRTIFSDKQHTIVETAPLNSHLLIIGKGRIFYHELNFSG